MAEPLPKRDNRDRGVSFRDRRESPSRPARVRAETLTGVGTVRQVRRIASILVAAALVLGGLVACSASDDAAVPAPEIGLTPGPGVSILGRPTASQTTVPRSEVGDGSPPLVFGDCVVELTRSSGGPVQRVTYGELSCAEAAERRPEAWTVVDLTDNLRAECPEDGRHISFTVGPLLPSSTSDYTFVCAERL